MMLYVVAQVKSQDGRRWELGGVFDDEAVAIENCPGINDCVMPVELNAFMPRDQSVVVGYYPNAGPREER